MLTVLGSSVRRAACGPDVGLCPLGGGSVVYTANTGSLDHQEEEVYRPGAREPNGE